MADQSGPPVNDPQDRKKRSRLADAARPQGWRVAPRPTVAACPRSTSRGRRTACAASDLRARAAGSQLALGAVFQPRRAASRQVPFSPYFLQQVQTRQVKSISSKATRSRARSRASRVPAQRLQGDADDAILDRGPDVLEQQRADELLLKCKNVQVNAKPEPGHSLWPRSCSASARRCCSSGCSSCSRGGRRGRRDGALGNFGRSQARRVDPEKIRVTFDDVAGIDEAKAELTEIVDFLRDPDAL